MLALGDTSYDGFCQAGKLIDTRLEQLGASRVVGRTDCDVDYEAQAAEWVQGAVASLVTLAGASGSPHSSEHRRAFRVDPQEPVPRRGPGQPTALTGRL